MGGTNTVWSWTAEPTATCDPFLQVNLGGGPASITGSIWVRPVKLGTTEDVLELTRLQTGTHPGASLALQMRRGVEGGISGADLVVKSPLQSAVIVLGDMPLNEWRHVKLTLSILGGVSRVSARYGKTTEATDAAVTMPATQPGAVGEPTTYFMLFQPQGLVASSTQIDIDEMVVTYP